MTPLCPTGPKILRKEESIYIHFLSLSPSPSHPSFFGCFETEFCFVVQEASTHYVSQTRLELLILLPHFLRAVIIDVYLHAWLSTFFS